MRLETERLILREFVASDWAATLAYQSDPRYLRYYQWAGRTAGEARDFVQIFLDQQAARPRHKFQLAVTTRADGQMIGNCGIRLAAPGARVGDIGYELAPDRWGRGYATEAAGAILAFGFTELGLHRVWASCVADNAASAHVLMKLGLRREAHLREVAHYKGRWWDEQIYAILEDEWRKTNGGRCPHHAEQRTTVVDGRS
ncbi:MAG TPA: GNAT family protein [Thermomicrobiales bacterium]|jgi:RimJ/RimL family protein N-acetyltransferase